ncbi:hypothetical protein QQM39_42635 [Streptomyces sp. DT2A-34]|uniref:hypothetical protein n=1 Tax=Streptomyces sp. DT2A-34 TaxID=3051182 RepID=UPI00265BF7BD|nr:hypothetical protein [Streptomyces sp. DT2A-34]MDO0917270.1 hypothetical protein [Streptomyces sp. DT2A-34]
MGALSVMADDRPDTNTPGQSGNDEDGTQPPLSPPPPPTDPPTPDGGQGGDTGGGWFSRHQQASWITGGATVLAALIAAMAQLLGSSGGDKTDSAPKPVPTSSASTVAPESVPASASPSKQTETPGPDHSSSPAGSELWRGPLLLDTEPMDLDAGQPVAVGYAKEGDVYILPGNEIEGWHGTVVSVWSGGTTSLPGYEECSNTVDAEGTDKQQLTKNTVLCIRTSAGNLARLKLTELGSDGIGSDHRNKFDAVIWDAG